MIRIISGNRVNRKIPIFDRLFQPFEIFNVKKRKRDETKINSPADFFGGTTGQRIQSASESSSTEQSIESDLLQGEVILEPWSEENIESTPGKWPT